MRRNLVRLFFLSALLPGVLFAQAPTTLLPENGTVGSCNFLTGQFHFDCVPAYIAYLVQFLFGGIGTLCLIELIVAGYQIATASLFGGSAEKGWNRLKYALIGLVVSLLAFAIVNFVISSLAS